MSPGCSTTREQLAEGASSPVLEAHLAGCVECAALAQALVEVDGGLASLSVIEPSDALVRITLARAEGPRAEAAHDEAAAPADLVVGHGEPGAPAPIGAPSLLVASLAVIASAFGALLAAPLAVARWLVTQRSGRWTFAAGSGLAACAALLTVTFRASAPALELALAGRDLASEEGRVSNETEAPATIVIDRERNAESLRTEGGEGAFDDGLVEGPVAAARDVPGSLDRSGMAAPVLAPTIDETVTVTSTTSAPASDALDGRFAGQFDTVDHFLANQRGPTSTIQVDPGDLAQRSPVALAGPAPGGTEAPRVPPADEAHRQRRMALARAPEEAVLSDDLEMVDAQQQAAVDGARSSRFWSDAERVDGLSLRARDGWWSTTYVPGDPAIRALHARLASARGARLGTQDGLTLAETAAPLASPIEAPRDRALAIGVQADVTAVEGPTRVRLEVDLRGIRQAAGRRAPMRIAVVIDARTALGADEAARLRALLGALGRAVGARDRIAIVAAGAHGGTVVPLGVLRHGEVEVALRRLFAQEGGAPVLTEAALTEAAQAVASPDDVGLVLFATPDAAHDHAIDGALHRAAVAGVPTSVVALGERARPEDLDAIAIAGQGRRRIVRAPSDAESVARAEIEAASQLVARAMRIRVRLAPGVQLVDVLGSRPLDGDESRRTREAERAIDVDLAQRLGISADREEDDDGVRIFVPAFYADDAHAILLDVVVPGPGPVAEIDVRYKDLVRLENGQASSAVSLPRGAPTRGARELHVVTSMLSHTASQALATAGDRAHAGDRAGAAEVLREARDAIDGTRRAMPRLARDRATTALIRLLDVYLEALASPSDPSLIAASARYASHRLIVRPRL